MTADGLVSQETSTFLKHLAERLAVKWGHHYSTLIYWIQTRLSFALLRATNLCIRGSQSKFKSLDFEDEAGISLQT